jgi:hypothetical protein
MSEPRTDPLNDLEDQFANGATEAARLADSRRAAVAGSLEKAAKKVHSGGDKVGELAHSTADKLEGTAKYMRENDAKDIMDDITAFAKKHPGGSLIAVAVLGFIAGRAMRSR